jgi:hypothetical protein
MDDRFAPRPVAGWFAPAALATLLLMLLGCALFVMHITADPAALPLDQRALFEAEPGWLVGALGVASGIGAVGAVMLLARRKSAATLLLISLILVFVWFAGLFAVAPVRDLLTTGEIAVAVVALALSWTIYWFARHSRRRGWLR